jgi:hypothetical protein
MQKAQTQHAIRACPYQLLVATPALVIQMRHFQPHAVLLFHAAWNTAP